MLYQILMCQIRELLWEMYQRLEPFNMQDLRDEQFNRYPM